MLIALTTPGSAFKPTLNKVSNLWRLKKFKQVYILKGGSPNASATSSISYGSEKDFIAY